MIPPQDPRRPTDLRTDAEPHGSAMLAESTGPGRFPPRRWPARQAACRRPAKAARRTVFCKTPAGDANERAVRPVWPP